MKGVRRPRELRGDSAGFDAAAVLPIADPEAQHECTVGEGLRNLVQLLPRVMRGLRRRPDEPSELEGVTLGPRHGSSLALVREEESTVGTLAIALGLNLATVSGLAADLERVGFVERSADPADRRRTIVRVRPGQETVVDAWLEGATAPIVRTLRQLSPHERAIFIKAMGYLDVELNAASATLASRHRHCDSDPEALDIPASPDLLSAEEPNRLVAKETA